MSETHHHCILHHDLHFTSKLVRSPESSNKEPHKIRTEWLEDNIRAQRFLNIGRAVENYLQVCDAFLKVMKIVMPTGDLHIKEIVRETVQAIDQLVKGFLRVSQRLRQLQTSRASKGRQLQVTRKLALCVADL